MKRNLMSKLGYHALLNIFEDTPSKYIPFSGQLPILDVSKKEEYNKYLFNEEFVEDCPEWVQDAVYKGEFVFTLDYNFKQYLKSKNMLDKWDSIKSSERATTLVRFLDSQSIGLESLEL